DLDLIVGIPRSGLLVANLLALHLNLPLTDVDGFLQGKLLQTGRRLNAQKSFDPAQNLTTLVVDDSMRTGRQMKCVRARLESAKLRHRIYYAAVYITPQVHQALDLWYEVLDTPRIFEWNIMHHSLLSKSCVDIDGVLCRDPEA